MLKNDCHYRIASIGFFTLVGILLLLTHELTLPPQGLLRSGDTHVSFSCSGLCVADHMRPVALSYSAKISSDQDTDILE